MQKLVTDAPKRAFLSDSGLISISLTFVHSPLNLADWDACFSVKYPAIPPDTKYSVFISKGVFYERDRSPYVLWGNMCKFLAHFDTMYMVSRLLSQIKRSPYP